MKTRYVLFLMGLLLIYILVWIQAYRPVVVDLEDNRLYDETKPLYQKIGLFIQIYTNFLSSYITNQYTTIGRTRDKKKIINFIKKYKIPWESATKCKNMSSIQECSDQFETINDFFIREKPIQVANMDQSILSSPCDARTLYYEHTKVAQEHWIKGQDYTLLSMMGLSESSPLAGYYDDSSILISRLAVVDYHRFHSPVTGIFLGSYKIPGSCKSVTPLLVNSKANIYNTNNRCIYFIDTVYFGVVAICIIGAIIVNSIQIRPKKIGESIQKGEELGHFNLGGSTLVTIIPANKRITVLPQLKKSHHKIETYVEVGTSLLFVN